MDFNNEIFCYRYKSSVINSGNALHTYVHVIVIAIMGTNGLPDMYTQSPRAEGVTHSFLDGFQPNLVQHFPHVCSTSHSVFSPKKTLECVCERLLHCRLIF